MDETGSLAAVLAGCAAAFDPGMIDGPAMRRIGRVAERLPASAAAYMGFELPLGRCAGKPDLCVGLTAGGRAVKEIAEGGPRRRGGRPDGLAAAVATAAMERTELWARRATLTILEYDTPSDLTAAVGPPAVFATLPAGGRAPGRGADGELVDIAAASLPRTCGMAPPRGTRAAVAALIGRVPPRCGILNTGVFPARSAETVRLVVSDMDPDRIRRLLDGTAAERSGRSAARMLAGLGGRVTAAGVSVDVLPGGIGPRVGLELFCGAADGRWHAARASDWAGLVEALSGAGLAGGNAAAALTWFGRTRMFTRAGPVVVHRGLNHLKVVCEGGPTGVKAYGGLAVLPWTGAGAARPDGDARP